MQVRHVWMMARIIADTFYVLQTVATRCYGDFAEHVKHKTKNSHDSLSGYDTRFYSEEFSSVWRGDFA